MSSGDGACHFCDLDAFRSAEVCIENDHCMYASSHDPRTDPDILPGSGIILPRAHRETPFDFTVEEWSATHELLLKAKASLEDRFRPDGYTLIWNCYPSAGQDMPHAHLHVIPRFADEPFAGCGGRWFIKQPENRRPDPRKPGQGLARW